MVVDRFSIFLAPFDQAVGAEIRKTRPCVIVSPDEMNRTVRTVIVAPLTSTRRNFPFRVDCVFDGRAGQIALDQLRSFDRMRLIKHLGKLDAPTAALVAETMTHMLK